MAQAGDEYVEADMQDVGAHYGEDGQNGHGPYYDLHNLDPSLLGDGISPSQASTGDASAEGLTPSKTKRKSAAPTKNGKKKRVVEVEEPESQESSEEAEDEEDEDAEPESEEEDEDEYEPEPVVSKRTRASLKRKVATPKTPKSTSKSSTKTRSSTRKSKSSKKDDVLPFHRTRRPPSKIIDARPIARSFEECGEADKKLIVMRDQHKKTWAEIRGVWEAITKQKTGKSTLPNRYERLKDNFSVIKEEDRPRLLAAKEEVEREMNEQKWTLIAEKVQEDGGGGEYSADHLQRQYKKLMVREGLRPPPGIVDRDFDIAISADEYGSD